MLSKESFMVELYSSRVDYTLFLLRCQRTEKQIIKKFKHLDFIKNYLIKVTKAFSIKSRL